MNNEKPLKEFYANKLKVKIFPDRELMGVAAALEVAEKIKKLQRLKKEINMIFAAAPSQNELLEELTAIKEIEFSGITAFHMDEYVGLGEEAPQRFGNFLYEKLFGKAKFKQVHYINPSEQNPEEECRRYASLLDKVSVDIVCMGIGENGHIAFNDPPFADFADPRLVKVVELDEKSRNQQVHDGCFDSLNKVPKKAITLTIPVLFNADFIFCVVPGNTKAEAVKETLKGRIDSNCPASVLRMHSNATLFLDVESAKYL